MGLWRVRRLLGDLGDLIVPILILLGILWLLQNPLRSVTYRLRLLPTIIAVILVAIYLVWRYIL